MGRTDKLGPLLQEELERTEGDPRVIVSLRPDVAVSSSTVSTLSNTGAEVLERNSDLGFVVMNALPDEIDELQSRDIVDQVELDAEVSIQARHDNPFRAAGSPITALDATAADNKRTIAEAKAQVGANRANERGLDGTGTTIAVLDTGVDESHPTLENSVTNVIQTADGDPQDPVGHGTWVASAISGEGAEVSGAILEGVAPMSNIINGKVLNDRGTGRISNIITGAQRAAKAGADVVNLSLGIPNACGQDSTICQSLDSIAANTNTVIAAAAGNLGPGRSPHLPAQCRNTIAVGSVRESGEPSSFSSRGPVCDGITYPDVAAPGGASNEGILGAAPDSATRALKGTSMATPYVAGAAALLKQSTPGITSAAIKELLERTASQTNSPNNNVGNGTINVLRATQQAGTNPPDTGTQPSPDLATVAIPGVIAGGLLLGELDT